mgnify:CR=1 FL=1
MACDGSTGEGFCGGTGDGEGLEGGRRAVEGGPSRFPRGMEADVSLAFLA